MISRLLLLMVILNGCMKRQDGDAPDSQSIPGNTDQPETPVDNPPNPPPGAGIVDKPSCPVPDSSHKFRLSNPKASDQPPEVTFADVRSQINAACKSCHLSPAASGGFTYTDAYQSQKLVVNDKLVNVPGFYETAETMRDVLVQGTMPPTKPNPDAYKPLGQLLNTWIETGRKEQGTGAAAGDYPALWGKLDQQTISDLGNCLPDAKTIGIDTDRDAFFDKAEQLPESLIDTDLNSMDTLQLATKGTLAYTVEYPLWNDHVQKLRHIHVPAVMKDDKPTVQALALIRKDNNSEPSFKIPENTRTYKTFFRGVQEKDGSIRYIPVETRLIVTRYAPRKPLFGTYVWEADGSKAKLLTTPYRDGTAWKDLTLTLDFNKKTGEKRSYVVPARHRCEQCHSGSANDSFVLGVTPLQFNRRDVGEAARDLPVAKDELSQIQRFVEYGLITNKDAAQLPKLEYFPALGMLNDHTLRAQGYMIGNCAHCHNPRGFAKVQGEIPLDFSAGRIFNFDTNMTSKSFGNRKIIHHQGDLAQSYLFHRVADSDNELKTEARMPLHSLASPDCRVVEVMARWIKSYDPLLSNFDVNAFNPGKACNKSDDYGTGDVNVVEQDPTDAGGPYKPRREDWNDPQNGMGEWFRGLRFNDDLHKIAASTYAVDWWSSAKKEVCTYPEVALDPGKVKPWMVRSGTTTLLKPAGQLYWTSPGAYFFNLTCTKCHGRLGEADGPLAANLDKWSGGSIRVANFRKGMFGGEGNNVLEFMHGGVDYSGNYFIWMALEGTKINPPPEVADILGANKAQMLKTIVDRCARLIPTNPKFVKSARDFDLFTDACTYNNLQPTDPVLQYDPDTGKPVNQEALDAWLRKSAANTGWMIYDYVRSRLAKGEQQFPQTECENVFKK